MLNIKNFDDLKDENLKKLLSDLRSKHVSRFPIDVVVHDNGMMVKFMDSRFPNDHFAYKQNDTEQQVAFIWYDGIDGRSEKPAYKIYSRLIQNDRYASYNQDYYTRSSTDLNKVAKFLKEYVKPFTALEIAHRTIEKVKDKHKNWVGEPAGEANRILRDFFTDDWLELFVKMKELGIPPINENHAKLYDEVVPAYTEKQYRVSLIPERIHVYINPDETVQVVYTNKRPTQLDMYDSMESVPHEIQQQVAMLQLSPPREYLGSVGIKMSDTEYWVDTLSK